MDVIGDTILACHWDFCDQVATIILLQESYFGIITLTAQRFAFHNVKGIFEVS